MVMNEIAKNINGYDRILFKTGEMGDFMAFSPFTGEELSGGFWWTLQDKIFDKFHRMFEETVLNDMIKNKGLCSDFFDFNNTPENMQFLIQDRQWYKKHIERQRKQHTGGEFCGIFSGLISCNYSSDMKMYICDVPIQYCPFCGVKLPPEFDQENWWEKEFKTFKWDKDHKLGEWADDYVDDHDWTEADYPLTEEEKAEYMEK